MRPNPSLARAARVALAMSAACLGWVAWSLSEAAVVEAVEGRRLMELQAEVAGSQESGTTGPLRTMTTVTGAPSPSSWGKLDEGDLVGRVRVERLGVSAIVLGGTTSRTLRRAVGHVSGTALPGQDGNVGLAGHRESFFRGLRDIRVGDTISLDTPHGGLRYLVDSVFVVDPEDVQVLDAPPAGQIITLVTCYPFRFIGPAPRRFIVRGHRLTPTSR